MNARRSFAVAALAALIVAAGAPVQRPASAQANLDAGKSPARIYAQGCGACHGGPHEFVAIRRDFLIKHYTTGPEQARLLADYIEAVRSEPRPSKPRRSPRAEIDVADVEATGSIGPAQPAAKSGTAPLEAAEDALAATADPTAVPLPAPLDIEE